MSDNELELHRQSANLLEKHTYFLLGAVGACIAFAFTQSKGLPLNYSQVPLGLAVFCWGLSFVFGCMRVQSILGLKLLNVGFLQVIAGTHEVSGTNPVAQKIGYDTFKKNIDLANNKVGFRYRMQFRLLVLGVVFYFAWHLYQMYLIK